MKKLVFLLAVAFSAALYSCGNKAEENAAAADSTAAPVDSAIEVVDAAVVAEGVDSVSGDTVVAAEEVVEAAPVQ